MNIVLSFYNTSRQMVRHNNSISFWTVNNNCNVPPVKRCVVFYSDFACLSIHARHDISIWNIASIEMMDESTIYKNTIGELAIFGIRVWELSTLFISLLYMENNMQFLYFF